MGLSVQSPAALIGLDGTDLGASESFEVTATSIEHFANSAGHRESDGAAPDFMVLSLVNHFLPQLLVVEEFSMGVNVGLDSVQFGDKVPAGSPIWATGEIVSAQEIGEGVQVVVRVTVHLDGETDPPLRADTVSRFFP